MQEGGNQPGLNQQQLADAAQSLREMMQQRQQQAQGNQSQPGQGTCPNGSCGPGGYPHGNSCPNDGWGIGRGPGAAPLELTNDSDGQAGNSDGLTPGEIKQPTPGILLATSPRAPEASTGASGQPLAPTTLIWRLGRVVARRSHRVIAPRSVAIFRLKRSSNSDKIILRPTRRQKPRQKPRQKQWRSREQFPRAAAPPRRSRYRSACGKRHGTDRRLGPSHRWTKNIDQSGGDQPVCRWPRALEGLPGLGKTELVKALAALTGCETSRLQFTPDLLPSDITGSQILIDTDRGRELEFRRGPVFSQLVLADEINRASPKTQAALLQAMAERQVTVHGATHDLPQPFFVLATQNPIDLDGTYPLPEAQLDRFLCKLSVTGIAPDILAQLLIERPDGRKEKPEAVLSPDQLQEAIDTCRRIVLPPAVADYAARVVHATRPDTPEASDFIRTNVRWGASPRGALALCSAARPPPCLTADPLSALKTSRHCSCRSWRTALC